MPDFSNLRLSRAYEEENQEDELDRLVAGHTAPPATADFTAHAAGFDDTLQDLLNEEDELIVEVPTTPALADGVSTAKGVGMVRKGDKNPHGATNKERVTDADARIYAHLGMFRVGDLDTLAQLQWSRYNPKTRNNSGALMSPATVADRLKKGKRLGMISKLKNPITGQHLWSVTDRGIAAARSFGFLERDDSVSWGGAEGMGFTHIDHYAAISHVAAKIVSPVGYYRDVFGEVSPGDLVSEAEIRRAQKPIKEQLFAEGQPGARRSFGEWRMERISVVLNELRSGKLALGDVLDLYPELWTIGQPDGAHAVKNTHWPDLVVSRESGRTTRASESIAVELERTIKPTAELAAILRTIKLELETPLIYGKFVYVGPEKVEKKLRQLDESLGLNLFESGRFQFLPLTDEEGNPLFARTTVGA